MVSVENVLTKNVLDVLPIFKANEEMLSRVQLLQGILMILLWSMDV